MKYIKLFEQYTEKWNRKLLQSSQEGDLNSVKKHMVWEIKNKKNDENIMNEKFKLIIEDDDTNEPTWLLEINIKDIWQKYNNKKIDNDNFFIKYKDILLNNKNNIIEKISDESYNELEKILEQYDNNEFEKKLNDIYDWGDKYGVKISVN